MSGAYLPKPFFLALGCGCPLPHLVPSSSPGKQMLRQGDCFPQVPKPDLFSFSCRGRWPSFWRMAWISACDGHESYNDPSAAVPTPPPPSEGVWA